MNDIIILSLLLEEPKHGYRLKQEAALFSAQLPLHNNTVYPLLNRFLKAGWITQREGDGERGQTRLLYEITAAGRKALREKLNEFSETDAADGNAFRLRVGLFGEWASSDRGLHEELSLVLLPALLSSLFERDGSLTSHISAVLWPGTLRWRRLCPVMPLKSRLPRGPSAPLSGGLEANCFARNRSLSCSSFHGASKNIKQRVVRKPVT